MHIFKISKPSIAENHYQRLLKFVEFKKLFIPYPINTLMGKITFLYPASPISPHYAHLTWAKSLNARIIKTPMGFRFFDNNKIPDSDILLLESLYCLPFAKRYKQKINPQCKIISIIADTSFWKEKSML